jgi:hypothetical protein
MNASDVGYDFYVALYRGSYVEPMYTSLSLFLHGDRWAGSVQYNVGCTL